MTFPFEQFISLVNFDQQTRVTQASIAKEQEQLRVVQQEQEALRAQLKDLVDQVHHAQKEVDAYELEAKSLDERERELKHKLDTLTNIKEYEPLKAELETVQADQMALEHTLIAAWNRLETTQRTLQLKKPEIETSSAHMQQAVAKKEEDIASLQAELDQKMHERTAQFGTIPEEWLEKYEHMRKLVPDPVLPIQQGACSGCFFAISDQDALRLKKRVLLQCKDCYRFLYDPAVVEAL